MVFEVEVRCACGTQQACCIVVLYDIIWQALLLSKAQVMPVAKAWLIIDILLDWFPVPGPAHKHSKQNINTRNQANHARRVDKRAVSCI